MDFNIEVRKKQLESLDNYISSSKDTVQSILDCLGWNVEKLSEDQNGAVCPLNSSHRLPEGSLLEHLQKCCLKSAGYNLDEKLLSEPINNAKSSINLDIHTKIGVLSKAHSEVPYFRSAWNGVDPDPKSADRFMTQYSKDERLALYDYCVQNTEGPTAPSEFYTLKPDAKIEEETMTPQELEEYKRNLKRRSVKYKSVHTENKNYREVMKEVIDGQMTQYETWLISQKQKLKQNVAPTETITQQPLVKEKETKNDDLEIERPHSSFSRSSNYSGSSRSTNRKRWSEDGRRSSSKRGSRPRSPDHRQSEHRKRSRDSDSHRKRTFFNRDSEEFRSPRSRKTESREQSVNLEQVLPERTQAEEQIDNNSKRRKVEKNQESHHSKNGKDREKYGFNFEENNHDSTKINDRRDKRQSERNETFFDKRSGSFNRGFDKKYSEERGSPRRDRRKNIGNDFRSNRKRFETR